MQRFLKGISLLILWFFAAALHVWSYGALYYCSFPANNIFHILSLAGYIIIVLLILAVSRKKTKGLLISLICFLAIAVWFITIMPDKNGIYPPELRMPYPEFKGDLVTLHNVRNCDYRTPEDFDVRYDTRTYDLDKLETVDMLVNYWGMDLVAHTFLSYGFSDGKYIAVSIEIRPEIDEEYGEINGLFKQYEIIYVWADERDLIRLRTNYKKEDIYIYRTSLSPDKVRKLFVNMLERTNSLYEDPEFYNTVTESCTNTIGDHIRKTGVEKLPFWKRRLLSGSVDKHAHNEGWLITGGLPFPKLRKNALINDRAVAADKDRHFSKKIRTHLTAM